MSQSLRENRFELVSRDLAKKLETLSEAQLRELGIAAVKIALERTGVTGEGVDEGLNAHAAGNFGDPLVLKKVESLVNELDKRQWELQAKVESGSVDKSVQTIAFLEARAVHALFFALNQDPLTAAQETLYEAHIVIQELEVLEDLIDR
jgi:hypothetical protein